MTYEMSEDESATLGHMEKRPGGGGSKLIRQFSRAQRTLKGSGHLLTLQPHSPTAQLVPQEQEVPKSSHVLRGSCARQWELRGRTGRLWTRLGGTGTLAIVGGGRLRLLPERGT